MAVLVAPTKSAPPALPELAGGLRYVVRQPIMDVGSRVYGYELLSRSGPRTRGGFRADSDLATITMLDNAVMFGLEKLTGGLPAFVKCTPESLIEGLVDILPSPMTVLELRDGLEPTPSLIKACRKRKAEGFRLALDNFTWKPKFEPLIELADYIKVDFFLTDAQERKSLLNRLSGAPAALLAEKVETQKQYKQARAEGFALFQGYYFCRPTLLENRKAPANRLSQIEILRVLHEDSFDLRRVARLVKRDASLTYRLLRLVNSPICAIRQEVNSIESAMLVIGEEAFRRMATLAITSELSADQPREVLRMALVRGRFCELSAKSCKLDPTEQYLLGMLSLLPAMLRLPMDELIPALPLREEIRQALKGELNSERALLQWLECHERGDWAESDAAIEAHGLNQVEVVGCYGEAVEWAEAAIRSVF